MRELWAGWVPVLFLLGSLLLPGDPPSAKADAPVSITFRVVAPSSPSTAALYWSGPLNRWDPGPEGIGNHPWAEETRLSRTGKGWTVTLDVPRGDTVRYRYTRGSTFSVVGAAGGGPRPPRQVVTDRAKTVLDTVETWRNRPTAPQEASWFKVPLTPASPTTVRRDGEGHRFSGTILYGTDRIRTFFRGYDLTTTLHRIPPGLADTLVYAWRMSNAPRRNTLRFLAGRNRPNGAWRVYADADNDGRIRHDDLALRLPPGTSTPRDTLLTLDYAVAVGDSLRPRSTEAELRFLPDPPGAYTSTRTEAPTLVLRPEFTVREGTLEMPDTTLTFAVRRPHNGHGVGWRGWHTVLVDRDSDGHYDVSKGSNERVEFQEPFRLGYLDLEVADIDPHGRWIRLRPAADAPNSHSRQPGDAVAAWTDPVFDAVPLERKRLRNRYVLLDFWASWCGPCIEALPTLQDARTRFDDRRFVLLGVVVNDQRSNVERVLNRYDIGWPHVYDGTSLKDYFRVRGLPDPILIGPDGTIVERGASLRGDRLFDTLSKYLPPAGTSPDP